MILVQFSPEVKGTSTVEDYKEWLEFESYSVNSTRHIHSQGGDRTLAQSHISELVLTKGGDQTSPVLFGQALTGKEFDNATIVVLHAAGVKNTSQKLLSITLTGVVVSSFATSCVTNSRPDEHLALSFKKIEYKYMCFDGSASKGDARMGYDVIAKKCF
ncbi:type VI secretion system tube protein Hcp [Pseudomonas vranovensis]|uniref:type VI secretion system tube protein Hcp n=1 Tax=Pseudomonas vranovensis TaxID=321661 RepID=UPI000A01A579|nr:type VI secretion system tube protein Hcp [Pseudomonas vranovensis]